MGPPHARLLPHRHCWTTHRGTIPLSHLLSPPLHSTVLSVPGPLAACCFPSILLSCPLAAGRMPPVCTSDLISPYMCVVCTFRKGAPLPQRPLTAHALPPPPPSPSSPLPPRIAIWSVFPHSQHRMCDIARERKAIDKACERARIHILISASFFPCCAWRAASWRPCAVDYALPQEPPFHLASSRRVAVRLPSLATPTVRILATRTRNAQSQRREGG